MSIAAAVPAIVRARRAFDEMLSPRPAPEKDPAQERRREFHKQVDKQISKYNAAMALRAMTLGSFDIAILASHLDIHLNPAPADQGYDMSIEITAGGHALRFDPEISEKKERYAYRIGGPRLFGSLPSL